MRLRITGQTPELGQEPQQTAPEPAGTSYDVSQLDATLKKRSEGQTPPQGSQEPSGLDWRRDPAGKWQEPQGATAPPPGQAPELTAEQRLKQYQGAVSEATALYKQETALHREHAANRHVDPSKWPADQPRPEVADKERQRIENSRLGNMESQIGQIEALTKRPIPPVKENDFRKLIDDRLDTLMQLSAVGTRPDVEPIRNQGDIRPRMAHQELSKDPDGLYRLADPNNPGQKTVANGEYVFVIPVSNPSQVWMGERANGGHTAISRGADVYYAGQVGFENGQITQWSNDSGHYTPKQDLHRQLGNTSIAMLENLLPRDKFVPYK